MAKIALLVGISKYTHGLSPLPAAVKDVEALARVLAHPEMGGFDTVKTLIDRDVQTIRQGIEALFTPGQKEDLALLFFSGHGIKDEYGILHLAGPQTLKNKHGNLFRSTAVDSAFIQDAMMRSRSRHKVIILDCCFSGAFGTGFLAKGNDVIDIEQQLGGEGIAVLTSSASTQYSFEQTSDEISIYTRYLVEGIETGAADLNHDGKISTNELHEYAESKVREAAPAMQPKFYGFEEGFRIYLSQAPTRDPRLQYRREVERAARHSTVAGEISEIARRTLNLLRAQLAIDPKIASQIEDEVLEPYRKKQRSLQHYDQALAVALAKQYPLSPQLELDLKRLQTILGLQHDDVAPIRAKLLAEKESAEFLLPKSESDKFSSGTASLPNAPLALEGATAGKTASTLSAKSQLHIQKLDMKSPVPSSVSRYVNLPLTLTALVITGMTIVPTYQFIARGTVTQSDIGFQASGLSMSPLIDEANAIRQALLNQLGDVHLTRAWKLYSVEGEIDAALEELNQVNSQSASYQDAQARLKQWPDAWEKNQSNYDIAQQAIRNWNLSKAERHAGALDETMPYWLEKQKELRTQITTARVQLPTPSPMPTPKLQSEEPPTTPANGNNTTVMTVAECEEIKQQYLAWENDAIEKVDGDNSQVRTLCDQVRVNIPSLF
jgi:uncharacterized caspase-like protein